MSVGTGALGPVQVRPVSVGSALGPVQVRVPLLAQSAGSGWERATFGQNMVEVQRNVRTLCRSQQPLLARVALIREPVLVWPALTEALVLVLVLTGFLFKRSGGSEASGQKLSCERAVGRRT